MLRHSWTPGPLALVLFVGCQQASPDLEARRQAVLAADSACEVAAAGDDVDEILSTCWTDDAILYPPGQSVLRGKEAIRRYVSSALETPGFEISWETHDVVMAESGEMAYLTHTNKITAPDSAGNLVTSRGKGVTIWHRTTDGEWRNVIDIWNAAPMPSDSS